MTSQRKTPKSKARSRAKFISGLRTVLSPILSSVRSAALAGAFVSLLGGTVASAYDNWQYSSSSLGTGFYGNIVNFPGTGKPLEITLNPGATVEFGNPGTTFTIKTASDDSGTRIDRTSLSSINLSTIGAAEATVQFGGDGRVFAETDYGYNGGAGSEDTWTLTGGQKFTTGLNLTFQSGGDGTNAIAGHDALNGGTGGAGGNSNFTLTNSSATFDGTTRFGGAAGDGGEGASYVSKYNPTKGGAGGTGGNAAWAVTNSIVEFKDSAQFGGDGGEGASGGQGSAEGAWASHGAGGKGGDAILTLNTGGNIRFYSDVVVGGNGGGSQRGTAGVGGTGSITLSGGTLQFDQKSQLGGQGGETSLGTAGAGGNASVLLSSGTFLANQSVQWGGTGGQAVAVGGVSGAGGAATVAFQGAQATFINNEGSRHQFGGNAGDSFYKTGAGGAGSLYFQGGTIILESANVGGAGGKTMAGQAGAGGEAKLYFGNAVTSIKDIQMGGSGGQALAQNATAGEGGKATLVFENGTHSIVKSIVGGTAGAVANNGNTSYLGAKGGQASVSISGGVVSFDKVTFGGKGSLVVTSTEGTGTGTGGAGGDVLLNVTGGNIDFGRVVFGGTGGNATDSESGYLGVAGAGGNVNAEFARGGVNFNDIVVFGGQGGQGATDGAGGTANVTFSGATVRFSNLAIFGGLDGTTEVSGLPSGDIEKAGKAAIFLNSGTVIIERGALLTSYNVESYFKATGGLLLFNVQPTQVGANNQVEMGAVELPRITIEGSAQLGITMSEWKSGTYELDKTTAALTAKDANSLKINNTTFDKLFYSLDVFRGEGDDANKLYLDKVTVRNPDEVWAAAGGNVAAYRQLEIPDDVDESINNMLMQSRSYEELETAVDHLGGTIVANSNVMQLARITSINQTVLSQIVQANGVANKGYVYDDSLSRVRYLGTDKGLLANNHVAPWVGYYGGTGDMGFSNHKSGYDLDSEGVIVGLDLPLYVMRLGGYYAFGESSVKTQSLIGNGKVDADDHLIGLYGKWNSIILGGYGYLSGNYSYSSYDSQRILTDGAAFGSFKNKQWGLYYEKGWQLPFICVILNPYIGLQYEDLYTKSFTETGSSDLRMSYGRSDLESFRGLLGLRGILTLGFFELSANAAYMREMGDLNPAINATLVSTADTMQFWGNGGGRDSLNAGAGVNLTFGQLSLMANYNLILSSELTFHAGVVTVRYKF